MDIQTEICLLLLLALSGGLESKCWQGVVSSCQDQLMPDPRNAFDRNPEVKCRGVRDYLLCLKKDEECFSQEVRANLIKYMDSIKLKCRGVNGERDDFQHGCREEEMTNCEKNLQNMASEHSKMNKKDKQEEQLFMCTALSWTKLCMIENASCTESVVNILAEETESSFGYDCSSGTPSLVSMTTLFILSLSLNLFMTTR